MKENHDEGNVQVIDFVYVRSSQALCWAAAGDYMHTPSRMRENFDRTAKMSIIYTTSSKLGHTQAHARARAHGQIFF